MTDDLDSCSKVLHCFKVNEEKLKTGQRTFVKIKIVSYIYKRLFRLTKKNVRLKNCAFCKMGTLMVRKL